MGKLIDLTSRLKAVPPAEQAVLKQTTSEVLSYAEQKQKILFHERRQVKRTILTEIVSSMVVLPEKGLLKVDLYDISEEGISFDLPSDQGKFKTYFPMIAQVKHVTDEPLEGVSRHGAIFLKGAATDTATDAALQYFIRFIEIAGVGLRKDDGDLMAPKIS
jgi:hypothetical protein